MSDIRDQRRALREVREKFGKRVGRDCDEWACPAKVEDGPLHRVNPRGRPGIFMCVEHAADYRSNDPEPAG